MDAWLSLAGRTAIVFGGGHRLGSAICKQLSRAGANVAVVDSDAELAQNTAVYINCSINAAGKGGQARHFGEDGRDTEQLGGFLQRIQEEMGELTIGVNCVHSTDAMQNACQLTRSLANVL